MYTKLKESQVLTRERKSESRFEVTPEWAAMKKDLDKGLKVGEAAQVGLTEKDKTTYRIKSRRTVARFVQKYLSEQGLEYAVKSFQRGGVEYVVVHHPEG